MEGVGLDSSIFSAPVKGEKRHAGLSARTWGKVPGSLKAGAPVGLWMGVLFAPSQELPDPRRQLGYPAIR